MKRVAFIFMALAVFSVSMPAFSNPKCSHRVASSGNNLRKNTNPVISVAAKSAPKASKTESGRR